MLRYQQCIASSCVGLFSLLFVPPTSCPPCACKDLDKFATEDIMDPIAKAKMVALKGIKKVMAQGSIGVAPGMNR